MTCSICSLVCRYYVLYVLILFSVCSLSPPSSFYFSHSMNFILSLNPQSALVCTLSLYFLAVRISTQCASFIGSFALGDPTDLTFLTLVYSSTCLCFMYLPMCVCVCMLTLLTDYHRLTGNFPPSINKNQKNQITYQSVTFIHLTNKLAFLFFIIPHPSSRNNILIIIFYIYPCQSWFFPQWTKIKKVYNFIFF